MTGGRAGAGLPTTSPPMPVPSPVPSVPRHRRSAVRTLRAGAALLACAAAVPLAACARKPAPAADDAQAGPANGAQGHAETDAALPAPPTPSAALERPPGPALGGLSAPVAGAVVGAGRLVVAGLVVEPGAVRVAAVDAQGARAWTRDVMAGVAWSPEAELKVQAARDGRVAVVYRGRRAGKATRELAILDASGAVVSERRVPETGCATGDAFVAVERGRARVVAFASTSGLGGPETALRADARVVCSTTEAWVLDVDGDGASARLVPAGAPTRLFAPTDDDPPRELVDLGGAGGARLARVSKTGEIELRGFGDAGPARKLASRAPRDADLAAADVGAARTVLVFTEDVGAKCPHKGEEVASTRVTAVRVRAPGARGAAADDRLELSPGACGREAGPFVAGAVGRAGGGRSVVWWAERAAAARGKPPISSLSVRWLGDEGEPPPLARLLVSADAVADAGCDDDACYAVALVRPEGTDGMAPEDLIVHRLAP